MSEDQSFEECNFSTPNMELAEVVVATPWSRVLEIGCAVGALAAHCQKDRTGTYWVGVEPTKAAIVYARQRLDEVYNCSVEAFENESYAESFDLVVLGDVLEHLEDPWSQLKRLVGFLKIGGSVVASIPNVNHWGVHHMLLRGRFTYQEHGIMDRTHLRFFTIAEIGELFEQAGLHVDNVQAISQESAGMNAFVESYCELQAKLGILNPNLGAELSTFQWIVRGKRVQ